MAFLKFKITHLLIIFFTIFTFGGAFLQYLLGSNIARNIGITLFLASILLFIIIKNKGEYFNIKNANFRIVIITIILLIISYPFWDSMYNAYSYIGIIVAYLVYVLDYSYLNKILSYIFILCGVLALIEYVSGSFLFVNTIEKLGGTVTFDEDTMSGAYGVFRSKAIFYGPLDFGNFIIGYLLLNRSNKWVIYGSFFIAFLANSRLALLISALIFINSIFKKKNSSTNVWFISILVCLGVFVLPVLSSGGIMNSVNRILDLFNTESGSNSARIFYWLSGINFYLNYDLVHLIFGNNGSFVKVFENSPENGWISLLVDNGIIGFLFYFISTAYLAIKFSLRKQMNNLIVVGTLFIVMFAQTFHLGASSNFMFWIVIFQLYTGIKTNSIREVYE